MLRKCSLQRPRARREEGASWILLGRQGRGGGARSGLGLDLRGLSPSFDRNSDGSLTGSMLLSDSDTRLRTARGGP